MYTDDSWLCSEALRSAVAQKAVEMGLNPCEVEKTILEKISRTGSGYSSLEALLEDCLNNSHESDTTETEKQGTVPPVSWGLFVALTNSVVDYTKPEQQGL